MVTEQRFFFDGDVESQVRQLIREAKEFIVLVSPYNDFWVNLKDELRDAIKKGVEVCLVYRAPENGARENGKDIKWLQQEGAEVLPVERLHSKLYANETTALVTSMNLLESSAINSKELCARFDGSEHAELLGYVHKLVGRGEEFLARQQTTRRSSKAASASKPAPPPPRSTSKAPSRINGHCIRCGKVVSWEKPLCADDFNKWKRDERWENKEKFCHRCGDEHTTSMKTPVCRSCWDTLSAELRAALPKPPSRR